MSSIYALEPPTSGKLVMHTTIGDIDIEFWPQQAPKACRNFVQLCLEGYYDGTIFHRIVKGFMAQGGDPTGTGQGGESVFGAPFKCETHSRLRFAHRGIVAMATPPTDPEANSSQFFITFDACEWLNGKHTVFGKVTGDTLYNVMGMQDLEVDSNDRPENAPKILSVDVLLPPFDDIVPREKKVPVQKQIKKIKKKKNPTLLSFGDEEASLQPPACKTMVSSHDIVDEDPYLLKTTVAEETDPPVCATELQNHQDFDGVAPKNVNDVHNPIGHVESQDDKNAAELASLRAQVSSLKSRAFRIEKDIPAEETNLLTPLEQRRMVYLRKKTTNRKQREAETLKKLSMFQETLKSAPESKETPQINEDDEDRGWLSHSLAFMKRPQDFDPMAADVNNYEYVLTDPLAERRPGSNKDNIKKGDDPQVLPDKSPKF